MEILNMLADLVMEILAAFGNILDSLAGTEFGDAIGLNGADYAGKPVDDGQPVTAQDLKDSPASGGIQVLIVIFVAAALFGGKIPFRKGGK